LKRLIVAAVLIFLMQTPAQAGFWDSLFAKKQDNATTQNAVATPQQPIFGGKIMSGRDLMAELRGIKGSLSAADPMQALSKMLLPAPPAPEPTISKAKAKGKIKSKAKAAQEPVAEAAPPAQPAQPGQELAKLTQGLGDMAQSLGSGSAASIGSSLADVMLDRFISELSFQAMEIFFTQLVDQPDMLSKVSVEVPDVSNMNPDLRKRVLNLAAFLVAVKASGLVIDASQKDFDAAKESYKKIMGTRQKASQALADAYFKRSQAASLKEIDKAQGTLSLRPQDEAFLSQLGNAKPEDFVKDPRVQTLAVELLRQSDPATYGQYTLEFGEMKTHYNAYARTAAGTASMLGFSTIFVKKANTLVRQQAIAGAVSLVPLLQQALPEILALAPRIMKVYTGGDESVSGSFSVERGGKVEKRGLSAQKVFASLDEQAKSSLRTGLINGGTSGILANLHLAAPATAAALADRMVKKDTKVLLAKHYEADQPIFSFTNTQAGKCGSPKTYKNITQGLFIQRQPEPDKACVGETGEQALMLAQRDLRDGVASLENSDLRKIMYTLSPNTIDTDPRLNLADTVVRIDNLGMDGLIDQQAMLEDRMKTHATEQSYAREAAGKKGLKGKRK